MLNSGWACLTEDIHISFICECTVCSVSPVVVDSQRDTSKLGCEVHRRTHLQNGVRACALIRGPAAICILQGKDHVDTVIDALIWNSWSHQLVIQLRQS